MSDQPELRCPICGVGVVTDIAFDRDPRQPDEATPQQSAETVELITYSCRCQVPGRSLASADAETLDVERRRSEDTVRPTS